jgi:isobutyryl-CoA mutase
VTETRSAHDTRAGEHTSPLRFVTATSLFDGHDASINIFRRILQASGAEVIHLGHNRTARDIVQTALQEDAHAIAITSYQGGHDEFFRYVRQLLDEGGGSHIKVFGGGGGTILPGEVAALEAEGIATLYSPDDGRRLGLQGMVDDMIAKAHDAELPMIEPSTTAPLSTSTPTVTARVISAAENHPSTFLAMYDNVKARAEASSVPVLGITGTGGAGKSSLVDELVRRFLTAYTTKTVAILSVDPSKRRTGGALLGDRIRMNSITDDRCYMRSLATRQANLALSSHVQDAINIVKAAGYDLVILETSGIGQSDTEIIDHADVSLYVMTPEYGAATQLEKIDMIDFADVIVVNKADKRGALDALRDVRKQFRRNHVLFDEPDDAIPVYGTVASQFNDAGVNTVFVKLMGLLDETTDTSFGLERQLVPAPPHGAAVVPPERARYLSEITETIARYGSWVDQQANLAERIHAIDVALGEVTDSAAADVLEVAKASLIVDLDPKNLALLDGWDDLVASYSAETLTYRVRGKDISVALTSTSLAHTEVPKVSLPRYTSHGDRLRWSLHENVPGQFPFAAGVFPFKRQNEDPTRMFAGEGSAEQTNRRFHYVSVGMPAKRLSTAFDSVTLYGENPDPRPDIYGKVGNSGVSIATLDDAKRLYSGFDLVDPATSVSMTINGPAPMLLGFFLNAAIDQQCERYIREHGLSDDVSRKINELHEGNPPTYEGDLPEGNDGLGLLLLGATGDQVLPPDVYETIKAKTMAAVRGTVQADILKEDQAQNTCIFSTEFALRMMGDIQEYFIENDIRNFYSVSISGYHMAEAGANPISQLAFTLANGFTFVEYYLSRGLAIDDFAPNLSFFFSNGIDAEYAVIGRVARRIWAKAMKHKYGANERSQKLKYHIQTSGRSLHAQEIGFNDIRTTLQALYAIYDNCNSLHTNAYDEAITTPTVESVRRALAIQLIINRELGLAKNENPLQGSFIIDDLTDLVEEAVLAEFDRLTARGGVLGAMESQYQRTKIQEESMYYERLKESGDYPIVGVNTFLSDTGSPFMVPDEVIRSTDEEKDRLVAQLRRYHALNGQSAATALADLQETALAGRNIFASLLEATKVCSLGQLSEALYDVGGQYRRNM